MSSEEKNLINPPLEQTPPPIPIENRVNELMENYSKYLTVAIIGYCLLTISHVHRFKLEWVDGHGLSNDYWSFLFLIPGYLLSLGSYLLSTKVLSPMLKDRYDPVRKRNYETDDERVKRMGNYIHGTIYYSFEVIVLFVLYYNTDYFPKSLGGTLDLVKIYQNYPQKHLKI